MIATTWNKHRRRWTPRSTSYASAGKSATASCPLAAVILPRRWRASVRHGSSDRRAREPAGKPGKNDGQASRQRRSQGLLVLHYLLLRARQPLAGYVPLAGWL